MVKSSRRNKPRSLALLGAGAAAAAPLAIQAAQQYGPALLSNIARRWRENEGPVRRRVRARRARRITAGDDKALVTAPQISQTESSGMILSSTQGQNMIPRPTALNNKRGRWRAGVNGPRICKSEFIGLIDGSVDFARQAFPGFADGAYRLNPGLEYAFPWLSGIATQFESYKFHRLAIHYVPSTNLNATGNLYMTPVIDPQQNIPVASRELISQFMDVVDTNVKVGATCAFPLGQKTEPYRWRFVRSTVDEAAGNLEAYDTGYFLFDRGGCVDTSVQGELWIDYDVELFNPKFRSAINRVEGGRIVAAGTVSAANPLGTTPTVDTSSVGFSVNASSQITFFNVGTFLMTGLCGGTAPTYTPSAVSPNTVLALHASVINATNNFSSQAYLITIANPQSPITVAGGGTVSSLTLWMGSAPQNSLTLSVIKKSLTQRIDELQELVTELSVKKDAPKFVYLPN